MKLFLPLVLCASSTALASPPPPPAHIQDAAIKQVEDPRLLRYVEKLAGFGTRHTLSDTASATRGIGAARNWIKTELESFVATSALPVEGTDKPEPRLKVDFEEFDAPKGPRLPDGGRIVNIVATLRGAQKESADRYYYIVAHYDSRNGEAMDATGDAPGANDNASGTAVVVEACRILCTQKLDATVVFLLTAGEEQGLIGANYHAAQAASRKENILGVLNNDIVGDPTDPEVRGGKYYTIRVFSEGLPRNPTTDQLATLRATAGEYDSPSRQLARFVEFVAPQHENALTQVGLIMRQDRFLRGGDHIAFNDNGFPAVRFSVYREHFDRQHANVSIKDSLPYGDVPRYVDATFMGRVARLNIATIMNLANAPQPPANVRIVNKDLGNDTLLRWSASPEPDVIGYEIVHRATTESSWSDSGVVDVGRATEFTIKINKDDNFFGVRAYDRQGYRSPVAFAGTAKE